MPGFTKAGATGPRCMTDAGRLSYREVQALANRYANVLKDGGSGAGTAGDHRPARRTRLRRGAVRHPEDRRRRSDGQPGAQARRHRVFLRVQPRRRGAGGRERADAFRAAAARAGHAPETAARGRPRVGIAPRRGAGNLAELSHPPGRRRHLALLRRHHGAAQGRGPAASLLRQHRAMLRPPDPRLHRGRRHAVGAQTLLRLRDGIQSASFPSRPAPPACCSRTAAPRRCSSAGSPGTGRPS